MKTEMEIEVHRVKVRRRLDGNLEIRVASEDKETIRLMEITLEESANLQRALGLINMISANL